MMQTFTKKWQTALISVFILLMGYAGAKACGWFEDDESSYSNYAPETFVTDNYKPFFYSSYNFYYDIGFDDKHDSRFNDVNIAEWSGFLGEGFSKAALNLLLNKASLQLVQSAYGYYLNKNALADSLKPFAASFNKDNSKQKAFLKYLNLAKACEQFAVGEAYDWGYDSKGDYYRKEKPQSTIQITPLVLANAIKEEPEPFIKQRYWFQLIRYHFFYNLPEAITVFENTKAQYDKNGMYYRTMAYAAGAYYKQKDYSKANYYYSLVFASNDKLKTVAHWSFHPQEESDWQQTLALCTNDKERITLWQMLGIFYGDEMRSMKEIYKLSPSDPSIDLLLTRLVNKLEEGENVQAKMIDEDFKWCQQTSKENKISNPFLWNMSTGYLAFMKGDFETAGQYYDIAAKKLPNKALAKNQLRLLQLLNKVASIKTITAKEEQHILPELQWLYEFTTETSKYEHFRYSNAQTALKEIISKKYAMQGDMVKSECFLTHSTFYVSDKNVNDLKVFLSKSNPSAFEQLCRKFSEKSLDDLWEYQSIQAAFKDDLDKAILCMGNAGKNAEVVLAGNPFNGNIQDCHDCDHARKQKIKYNKLSFLQKMKEMKDNINTGTDVYNNAILLANGYYNITHFGNARYFYEGVVLGSGHAEPDMIDSVFRRMLTDNSLSVKYYTVALQHAANDEQKAKSLYMLAKCERNDWYKKTIFDFTNTYTYRDNHEIDFITWNSFKALKNYKNTQYYKDVINECGYFRTAMQR